MIEVLHMDWFHENTTAPPPFHSTAVQDITNKLCIQIIQIVFVFSSQVTYQYVLQNTRTEATYY